MKIAKEVILRSYFSLPTDLAGEMRRWKEFVSGKDYSVDLMNSETGETVAVRFVEKDEDCYVIIKCSNPDELFDRVIGRAVRALAMHSDNLMISGK